MSRAYDNFRESMLGFCLAASVCSAVDAANAGDYTVLYKFGGGKYGFEPKAPLIHDTAGNLYGTTAAGGARNGTVFRIAPDRTETVLYKFKGGNDGAGPVAGLLADASGNLFGTTVGGGGSGCGGVAAAPFSSWRQAAPRPCFTGSAQARIVLTAGFLSLV